MTNHIAMKPRPSIWAVLALLGSSAFALASLALLATTGFAPL
ncbi:MAG: hypothetical protein ACJ798_02830 [Phenylobacterium sp.]